MESNKAVVPVTLKGGNYLLWSRLVKTAVGSKGLWGHITQSEAPKLITYEGDKEIVECDEEKWEQDDQLVMSILQRSLEVSILVAYSYCETAKDLWDTLKKVYGNISNLSRVFEVKRAINSLTQEDMEFTKHLGRFRALWSELEMLRPGTTNLDELAERREQDKVFGLLLTLNPSYNSLIKHILRSGKLPDLEEVCAQVQKEEGSIGLFGGKGEITLANQAEVPQANRASSNQYDAKKFTGNCDHCKRQGHKKNQCWILHPHLKPAKFSREKDRRANVSYAGSEPGSSSVAGSSGQAGEGGTREPGDSKALVTYTPQPSLQNNRENEYLRRSDLDSLIKMLKENSNTLGTLGYSFGALYESCSIAREPDHSSIVYKPTSILGQSHIAHNLFKPLVVDSGASHHMISDTSLIRDIEPTNGHVMIANGDKIPIRGIGKLKLFDKDSKAFYMPDFTSNLLSVKKCTTDLNCNVIFSPNDVKFQDIESSQLIGKRVTKGDLYLLEELAPVSDYFCSFTSASMMNKNALWHARLGHPHVRALNLMLPGVVFENKDCEACILGKRCKTVFPISSTVYDKCFDLIHSDVWTAPCLSRDSFK
ncbi:hypothetical protein YC2023_018450 [Brassica napus]